MATAEFWRDRRVLVTGHTGFKVISVAEPEAGLHEDIRALGITPVAHLDAMLGDDGIEAVILTSFGGAVGVAIGLLGSFAIATALDFPFVVDASMIFIAFVFCVLIGIAFGYLPARRAASLDPIEALRYE